jgi:hypothetical protein
VILSNDRNIVLSGGVRSLTPEEAALIVRSFAEDDTLADALADITSNEYRLLQKLRECARWVPKPLGTDKVWSGGTTRIIEGYLRRDWRGPVIQSESVVRAKSIAHALKILGDAGEMISRDFFVNHWSNHASREQLCIATEHGVWAKSKGGWVKGREGPHGGQEGA